MGAPVSYKKNLPPAAPAASTAATEEDDFFGSFGVK